MDYQGAWKKDLGSALEKALKRGARLSALAEETGISMSRLNLFQRNGHLGAESCKALERWLIEAGCLAPSVPSWIGLEYLSLECKSFDELAHRALSAGCYEVVRECGELQVRLSGLLQAYERLRVQVEAAERSKGCQQCG